MLKIAPEGWPFVAAAAVLTLAAYLIWRPWTAVLPFVLFLFMLFFFRDPERAVPAGKDIFVSPADGKVIVVRDTTEDEYIGGRARQISIFMSPFNVHVNRAPCDGKVVTVKHTPGGFSAAYTDEASLSNENIAMLLDTEYGKVLVRQVAGLVARRAVCRVAPGDRLKRGERYGIIKFSSRVDLYLPEEVEILVKVGQRVRAGETIVARR
ncbi:MAG TPA: phosphatidylserine decarboxylase family protein [Nitrospirae bacterium]|nr:phosphatidylserine decarboxylase family protein [Nitrospirota bacterium]